MAPRIGIVADDLTGAADTAVAFLADGVSVLVRWPDRAGGRDWLSIDAQVLAVDTRGRATDLECARGMTCEVVSAFRACGVGTLYKKIDSMLRGHVGGEVRAALDGWHPGSIAVVAPAFPAAGRTTLNGYQCVDGMPLAGREPVTATLEQAGIPTRHADLDCVRSAALDEMFRASVIDAAAIVCDAEDEADLAAIARAGAGLDSPIVWVGSGGLAHAIASKHRTAGSGPRPLHPKLSGPLLFVVGSTAEIARGQADHLAAAGVRHVAVPVASLAGGLSTARADFGPEIRNHFRAGEDVLVTVRPDGEKHIEDAALMARLGELLRTCATSAGGLVLTGGDTAIGVLQAWGTLAIRLVDEIAPGIVLATAVGPLSIPVVTKAGSFGDRATLTRVRDRLHGRG
jgi:4-hydroxythreonine-4-phosphate dehydrogenase